MAVALTLVLGSGIAHAVWNLFTKSSRDKKVFLWLINFGGFIVFLPFLIYEMAQGIPLAGYGLMAVTLGFQIMYAYLLPIAYQRAEMSQAYPVMRGIAALLVPLLGVWLFGESLTTIGWLGVAAIVAGLFAIGARGNRQLNRGQMLHAFLPILGVGAAITGYTLNDKLLLSYISPLALIEVCNIGFVIILARSAWKPKAIRTEWDGSWKQIVIGSVLSPGSYLLFLFAMDVGPVSQLAPIREISTVIGTLLGIWLLKEAGGAGRVLYAGIITAGIIAIGAWGT
ncbi:EamA family transporter [Paenibacillus soyae]|uniref:LuxR family transcriptional regulator n=1 Tax=Paenibacillus soyae TaxID=2969249 RepID=A0A9X2MPM2_9BACL|nr:LuxR family transcriptional regulator [Paenibacillus soyae]MCR2805903.1 LuxR family transcriptional regulator [Paenibacillus soyae]